MSNSPDYRLYVCDTNYANNIYQKIHENNVYVHNVYTMYRLQEALNGRSFLH